MTEATKIIEEPSHKIGKLAFITSQKSSPAGATIFYIINFLLQMEEKTFVLCKCGKWVPKTCYRHHLDTKKHKRYIWEQNCHDADVTVPPYINELLLP